MLSEASRIYDRSMKVKPLTRKQRQKMYASKSVKVQKKIGQKKFSPFNTINRDARDSYLLRVTKEPNTQTNYNVNDSHLSPSNKRPTIDKAKFERIIGDVKKEDFSVELPRDADHRCVQSQTLTPQSQRPFTVRDHQSWRKTFEHIDFSKQQSTKRVKLFPKLSVQESTNNSLMNTLRQTLESNFNNFDRFKFRPRQNRAHSFTSDIGHEYLKEFEKRDKSPEYDILTNNEAIIRKSMIKPKVFVQFDKYRPIITTRLDRNDPQWHTKLNYDVWQQKDKKVMHFEQGLERLPNEVHSKYPIRLSLQKVTRLSKE